jgi:hypothetical protein
MPAHLAFWCSSFEYGDKQLMDLGEYTQLIPWVSPPLALATMVRAPGGIFAAMSHTKKTRVVRRAEVPLFGNAPVGARRCLAAGDMQRFRSGEAHCAARGPLALPRGLHATCWEGGTYKEQCGEELGFIAPNGPLLTVVRSPQGVFASHRPKIEKALFGAPTRAPKNRRGERVEHLHCIAPGGTFRLDNACADRQFRDRAVMTPQARASWNALASYGDCWRTITTRAPTCGAWLGPRQLFGGPVAVVHAADNTFSAAHPARIWQEMRRDRAEKPLFGALRRRRRSR